MADGKFSIKGNMKTRLGIFVCSLLALPAAGLWLSGYELRMPSSGGLPETANTPAVLLTTLIFTGYILLINHLIKLLSGNNLLNLQRNYFIHIGTASAILGWLLVYLNLFVTSWGTQTDNFFLQILLYTPLFALLAPAVLITRALIGSFSGLLKHLSRGRPFPELRNETLVFSLLPFAALGLMGGAAWPEKLFWLLWIAPLLLLSGLQLLWREQTIFSGLKSGDWGRLTCTAMAGVIVGNFVVFVYQNNGGITTISLSSSFVIQLGYVTFGLLCLQLSDVLAEGRQGKLHTPLSKKPFPIHIVAKSTSRKNTNHV